MFVYEMSEVEKMTKEASPRQYGRQGNNYGGLQNLSRGYRPNGYRGFMELGGGPGVGDYGDGFVSFSTSHGGQISPYFFLGAGIGFDYHYFSLGYNLQSARVGHYSYYGYGGYSVSIRGLKEIIGGITFKFGVHF